MFHCLISKKTSNIGFHSTCQHSTYSKINHVVQRRNALLGQHRRLYVQQRKHQLEPLPGYDRQKLFFADIPRHRATTNLNTDRLRTLAGNYVTSLLKALLDKNTNAKTSKASGVRWSKLSPVAQTRQNVEF